MVLKVEWNQKLPFVFASSGADHKIKLWDMSKINSQKEEVMFFVHSGHKGVINDFSWNPCKDLELVSVDSKNQLQCWNPQEQFFYQ